MMSSLPSSRGYFNDDRLFPIDDIRQLIYHNEDYHSTTSTITFSQTRAGWVIPTVTSLVSLCASALIIYIIARSDRNRHTATYHRIMGFMSIADMISSLAASLTTIPMPKDVNEVYNFDGKSFGTVMTCEIQGVSRELGVRLSATTSMCLSLYYLLTIRYHVSHRIITKYVEPACLVTMLLTSIIPVTLSWKRKLYNPTPCWSWCAMGEFPYGCSEGDGLGCIRGQEGAAAEATSLIWVQLIISAVLQVVCLGSIVVTVYSRDKEQARTDFTKIDGGNQSEPNYEEQSQPAPMEEAPRRVEGDDRYQEVDGEEDIQLQHITGARHIQDSTRMILIHAIMYAVAFLGPHFLIPQLSPDSKMLIILALIFRPLQGFFNALIFISQKLYIIRQADENLTFREALNRIFMSPSVIPAVVIELPSRLHTLRNRSAHSRSSPFPNSRASNDPSLVISNSAGSKELPADRRVKGYYDSVHIPTFDMPAPNTGFPTVTHDSYMSDSSFLDTIDEEMVVEEG